MTETQERIYNHCIKTKPSWRLNKKRLVKIIEMSDTEGDGFKRIVIRNKTQKGAIIDSKTYLVPIEDVICYGVKAEEIPLKYKEVDDV